MQFIIQTVYCGCFRMLSLDPIEDEAGDFMSSEHLEHRRVAEAERQRVTWNIERRCFMDAGATKRCVHMYYCRSGKRRCLTSSFNLI